MYSLYDDARLLVHLITDVWQLEDYRIVTHDRGSSVGILVVTMLAEAKAPMPADLVITNGNIYLPLANLTAYQKALLDDSTSRATAAATTPDMLAAGLGASTFMPPRRTLEDAEIAALAQCFAHNDGIQVLPDTIQYLHERAADETRWLEALAANPPVDTTLVWGGLHDTVAPLRVANHVWHTYLKDKPGRSRYWVVPGADHYVQCDAPKQLADILRLTVVGDPAELQTLGGIRRKARCWWTRATETAPAERTALPESGGTLAAVRTDNDTWDITTSVGSTALFVAAARALEAQKPDPLAVDPFAEVFCRAVGGPWAAVLDGEAPDHPLKSEEFGQHFVTFQAARTRYFDTYFGYVAQAGGVRQVVILAAGLDSRAYRLDWAPDTTIYELDQPPQVLDFKREALAAHGGLARRPSVGRSPSTFATTGRKHCGTTVSVLMSRRRGSPRDFSSTFPPLRKNSCSPGSTAWRVRVATSPLRRAGRWIATRSGPRCRRTRASTIRVASGGSWSTTNSTRPRRSGSVSVAG